MARWRLRQPHYLNVPGTEWEYKEQSQQTGKSARKVYEVPMFLHPDDAADHNYPGEIIVSDGMDAQRRDIIFLGPPTPDMEPLDEAAEQITKQCEKKWIHPIESLPGNGFSQSLIADLERQINEIRVGQPATPVAAPGVSVEEFSKLKDQMALLMEQNAHLENRLVEQQARRA